MDSGLDWLVASVDGATPDTYNTYRRGGNFDLVISNLRKISAEKNKKNRKTPVLNWRFFTFAHNTHEIDEAFNLAKQTGCDQITIGKPFSVEWYDEDIKVALQPSERRGCYNLMYDYNSFVNNVDDMIDLIDKDAINDAFMTFLEDPVPDEIPTNLESTCEWLYQNLTIDALGRVMPCCSTPFTGSMTLIFDDSVSTDSYNSDKYKSGRKYFIKKGALFTFLKKHKVVLFGAGNNGRMLLKELRDNGVTPAYFVDNNTGLESSQTSRNGGIIIKHPQALLIEDQNNLKIIISPSAPAYFEIQAQINEMGLGACIFPFTEKIGKIRNQDTICEVCTPHDIPPLNTAIRKNMNTFDFYSCLSNESKQILTNWYSY